MGTPTATPTGPTDPNELKKILHCASEGDESALPAVREMLKDAGTVERLGGNLVPGRTSPDPRRGRREPFLSGGAYSQAGPAVR